MGSPGKSPSIKSRKSLVILNMVALVIILCAIVFLVVAITTSQTKLIFDTQTEPISPLRLSVDKEYVLHIGLKNIGSRPFDKRFKVEVRRNDQSLFNDEYDFTNAILNPQDSRELRNTDTLKLPENYIERDQFEIIGSYQSLLRTITIRQPFTLPVEKALEITKITINPEEPKILDELSMSVTVKNNSKKPIKGPLVIAPFFNESGIGYNNFLINDEIFNPGKEETFYLPQVSEKLYNEGTSTILIVVNPTEELLSRGGIDMKGWQLTKKIIGEDFKIKDIFVKDNPYALEHLQAESDVPAPYIYNSAAAKKKEILQHGMV